MTTASPGPLQSLRLALAGMWRDAAHRRLTQVWEAAPVFPFDDSTPLVFLSDCHRGDNSRADAFAPNEGLFLYALHEYYRRGFTYVEVGDGDEMWKNWLFGAVRRAHEQVFDLIQRFEQAGRLLLVAGNHDYAGGRRSRPLVKDGIPAHEGLILEHSRTLERLFVVHGHQADPKSDLFSAISRQAVRHVWKRLQNLGLVSTTARAHDEPVGGGPPAIEQRIVEWVRDVGQAIICGHTHRPALPEIGAPPYLNTGSCIFPGYLTGLELAGGQITAVGWSALPGAGSGLAATRTLLAPPRLLHQLR